MDVKFLLLLLKTEFYLSKHSKCAFILLIKFITEVVKNIRTKELKSIKILALLNIQCVEK